MGCCVSEAIEIEKWFLLIEPGLHGCAIDPVNVYNMDETEVMLSGPRALEVLVGKGDIGLRDVRVNWGVITAIEGIRQTAGHLAMMPPIVARGQHIQPLISILHAPNLASQLSYELCIGKWTRIKKFLYNSRCREMQTVNCFELFERENRNMTFLISEMIYNSIYRLKSFMHLPTVLSRRW